MLCDPEGLINRSWGNACRSASPDGHWHHLLQGLLSYAQTFAGWAQGCEVRDSRKLLCTQFMLLQATQKAGHSVRAFKPRPPSTLELLIDVSSSEMEVLALRPEPPFTDPSWPEIAKRQKVSEHTLESQKKAPKSPIFGLFQTFWDISGDFSADHQKDPFFENFFFSFGHGRLGDSCAWRLGLEFLLSWTWSGQELLLLKLQAHPPISKTKPVSLLRIGQGPLWSRVKSNIGRLTWRGVKATLRLSLTSDSPIRAWIGHPAKTFYLPSPKECYWPSWRLQTQECGPKYDHTRMTMIASTWNSAWNYDADSNPAPPNPGSRCLRWLKQVKQVSRATVVIDPTVARACTKETPWNEFHQNIFR